MKIWIVAWLASSALGCQHHASAPAPLDRSCATVDDCAPEPECCVDPCGAPLVNRKELDRARAALDCGSVQCPVAGACSQRTQRACVDRQCKLVPE